MPEGWYVVQTQPSAEMKALAHLERQGFGGYLPRYSKRRRHARRVETILAPLFPRYLFVRIDVETQRWRAIQSTVGVSKLVCRGELPARVPDGVIDGLRGREGSNGAIELAPAPRFTRGEQIRIVDGVFSMALGLYEGMTDRDRVAVLLELFGRKVRVVVDDLSIVAA